MIPRWLSGEHYGNLGGDIMNEIPDIYYDGNPYNPCIVSPNAPYALFFEQTKEIFLNADMFKKFVDNVKAQFRHMRVYSRYKAYLYEIGLDRCQILGNITADMATIEMHHNGISLADIIIMITTHLINTEGKCTSFDILHHLRMIHTRNMVPLVMLCKSMHQLEENDAEFYVPIHFTFGDWPTLLDNYKYGITYGIAKKLRIWIKKSMQEQISKDAATINARLTMLNNSIRDWSEYNECCFNNNNYNNVINPYNFSLFINNNIQQAG